MSPLAKKIVIAVAELLVIDCIIALLKGYREGQRQATNETESTKTYGNQPWN